jgi:hypothetical protein
MHFPMAGSGLPPTSSPIVSICFLEGFEPWYYLKDIPIFLVFRISDVEDFF